MSVQIIGMRVVTLTGVMLRKSKQLPMNGTVVHTGLLPELEDAFTCEWRLSERYVDQENRQKNMP